MKATEDKRRSIGRIIATGLTVLGILLLKHIDVEAAEAIKITKPSELESIGQTSEYPLDGDYVLGANLDMSGIDHMPIGTAEKPFTGTFDGAGYVISHLSIKGTNIGPIAGLCEQGLTGYGLFGVIKADDNGTYVKNVTISDAYISDTKAGDSAAGILAAVVYNGANIDNVAVVGGSIQLKASKDKDLHGAGALIGVVWTDIGQRLADKTKVTDILCMASVSATGYTGENTVSGVIGCVYNTSIDTMERVVSVGALTYGSGAGYGLATSLKYDGNGIADSVSRAYYALEDGRIDSMIGSSISKGILASGAVALGDKWSKGQGMLPTLSISDSVSTIKQRIYISHKRNESLGHISSDFLVATTYNGAAIVWTSSTESLVIDKDTGRVTVSTVDGVAEKATLTYTCGDETGKIELTLGEHKDISFNTQFVKPGQTLKVLYAPAGATYKWSKKNQATGKTTSWDDTTGEYVVTEADLESFITVTVNGKTKLSIYVSTLPVVYIDTSKSFSWISKTTYYKGTLTLTGDSEEYAPWDLYSGDIEFKGRGHSSSYYKKVGLKLKLAEKSDMYGVSGYENKHWALVSNVLDGTFSRSSIIYKLAEYMAEHSVMEYTDVILIYNDDYKGVYQLYEHVRIADGRVEVFDYDDYAKDIAKAIAKSMVKYGQLSAHYEDIYVDELREKMESDYSYIDNGYIEYEGMRHMFADYGIDVVEPTGGYLVVMDRYSQDANYTKQAILHTAYTLPFYVDKPTTDDISQLTSMRKSSLYNFAVKYNQSFEYALHSDDFFFNNDDVHYKVVSKGSSNGGKWNGAVYAETTYTDDVNNGKHYSQLFDMDSLVHNFLICEFSQNYDSMKNSFYYKKDIGELAEVTPFWDYDWSMGNWITTRYTNMPTKWQTTLTGATEMFYQSVSWNRMLIRDPYFLMKVWETYGEIRPTIIEELIKDGGYIDTRYERLKLVAPANEAKWKDLGIFMSYDKAYNALNTFLDKRIPWFDKQFESVDTLIASLGYYHSSDYLSVGDITKNADGSVQIEAVVSNTNVKYVAFQVNGTHLVTAKVENGKATVSIPADAVVTDGCNMVEVKAMDDSEQYIVNDKYSDPGNYNLIHSNYKVFE